VNAPSAGSRLVGAVVALAAALVIVAVSIVPFLSPAWIGFEQGRSGAAVLTGFSEADLRVVTDSIVADLVAGPPDFDVQLAGTAVLGEAERSHMRDVRAVFGGFFGVAAAGLVILGVAFWWPGRQSGGWTRARTWQGVRAGAVGLAGAVALAGVVVAVAFDAAFEVFHRLFFAEGSYLFDPRTERLVQLFPEQFWSETAIAAGVLIFVLAIATAWFAGRRDRGATS
jgi:integral membrane protein (TIGR01906 family)